MSRKFSKRLVIDACIAKSAGVRNERARCCRDFLILVREICHRIVMTDDILHEWKCHMSGFSSLWLTNMTSRGKIKLCYIEVDPNPQLRKKIEDNAKTDITRREMLKDLPIIQAAIAADKVVVSLDKTAKKNFLSVCSSVHELRSIIWVNPEKKEDNIVSWIKQGAKAEIHRQLRSQVKK